MRQQMAEGDRHIGILRVQQRKVQVWRDLVVELEQSLFVQHHDGGGRHHFADRGDMEGRVGAGLQARVDIGHAVAARKDGLVAAHDGHAHGRRFGARQAVAHEGVKGGFPGRVGGIGGAAGLQQGQCNAQSQYASSFHGVRSSSAKFAPDAGV